MCCAVVWSRVCFSLPDFVFWFFLAIRLLLPFAATTTATATIIICFGFVCVCVYVFHLRLKFKMAARHNDYNIKQKIRFKSHESHAVVLCHRIVVVVARLFHADCCDYTSCHVMAVNRINNIRRNEKENGRNVPRCQNLNLI